MPSLTPVCGHKASLSQSRAGRAHGEALPLLVCDLASIRYELECSLEWLAVDDNRELTAKVWLLMLDTYACTHDAPSGGRAGRTRQRSDVVGRRDVRFPMICSPFRVTLFYLGVLTPFLSISMAFSNLFRRVSCFLASVIQRQYSLRWV